MKTNLIVAAALLMSVAAMAQTQTPAVKPAAPTQAMTAQHAAIKTAREQMRLHRSTFIADRKAAKAACQTAGAACDAAKAKLEADKKTMKADQDSLRQSFEALRATQQAAHPVQSTKPAAAQTPAATGK